jgi:hypothetical protein
MMDLERLDELRKQGDPEADAVVRAMAATFDGDTGALAAELGRLPARVFRWTSGQPRPHPEDAGRRLTPVEMAKDEERWLLIEDYLRKPYALTRSQLDLLRAAQDTYADKANLARAIFGIYGLPVLYVHPEIALTLAGSGRLIEQVRRRINETQKFVDVVMERGSFESADPRSDARTWIRKVRLMHAIRRELARSGDVHPDNPLVCMNRHVHWQERDDEPIDQVEVAFVMLIFSWVVVDGLPRLGRRFRMTRDEARNHVLAWGVIAQMLGVRPELTPSAESALEDAEALYETIRARNLATGHYRKSKQSQAWTRACEDEVRHESIVQAGLAAGRQLMAALMVVAIDLQNEHWPQTRGMQWVRRQPLLVAALQDLPRVLVRKLAGRQVAELLYLGRAPFLHWLVCEIGLMFIDLREWDTGGAHERVPGSSDARLRMAHGTVELQRK